MGETKTRPSHKGKSLPIGLDKVRLNEKSELGILAESSPCNKALMKVLQRFHPLGVSTKEVGRSFWCCVTSKIGRQACQETV